VTPTLYQRHGGYFHGTNIWLLGGLIGLLVTGFSGIPFLGIVALAAVAYGAHRSIKGESIPAPVLVGPGERPFVPLMNPAVQQIKQPLPVVPPPDRRVAVKRAVLTPRTIRTVPFRDRAAHVAEGASMSALLTAVFTACIALFAPEFFGSVRGVASGIEPALVGLFGGTALCGAWSLLGVNSLLEGRQIGPCMRRLISLLLGCVVGEVAWGLSELLYVHMPDSREAAFRSINSQPLMDSAGPTWLGYLVFFGLLFGLRRWWWQTDSYRPKRFRSCRWR
jgi:hypothetical protein